MGSKFVGERIVCDRSGKRNGWGIQAGDNAGIGRRATQENRTDIHAQGRAFVCKQLQGIQRLCRGQRRERPAGLLIRRLQPRGISPAGDCCTRLQDLRCNRLRCNSKRRQIGQRSLPRLPESRPRCGLYSEQQQHHHLQPQGKGKCNSLFPRRRIHTAHFR